MNWRPEIVFRPENGQPVDAARFGDGAIAILVPEHGLAFSIFVVLKFSFLTFLKISDSLLFVVVKVIVPYRGLRILAQTSISWQAQGTKWGIMVNSKAHSKRISYENTFCFDLKGR